MARQITRQSSPSRSPYSTEAPFERAAGRAAGRREQGPLTQRVRGVLAAEEEHRRAGRVLDPGDIPELEAAPESAFARALLRAAEAPPPATLRAPAPHIESAIQHELLAPLTPAVQQRIRDRPKPYQEAMTECSARIVTDALDWAGGNKRQAAKALELSRPGLYKILWRAGLPT